MPVAVNVILKILKSKVFWIVLAAVAIFGLGAYTTYRLTRPDAVQEELMGEYLGTAPVDELLTSHLYLPILKVKPEGGILYLLGLKKPIQKDIKGYCLREYEVAVGYSHIKDMIHNPDIMREVCSSSPPEEFLYVPEPVIQKLYAVRSSAKGDFPRRECDTLDLDPGVTPYRPRVTIPVARIEGLGEGPSESIQQRKSLVILTEMMESDYKDYWDSTRQKSREVLAGYLGIFCGTTTVRKMIQQ